MKNVIFLHIPKTAGQTVHFELERALGKGNVSPVRVNEQWVLHSIKDLKKYSLHSGHIDWSLVDFVPEPKITFTVLRDPLERIASLYLYLLNKSQSMSDEELSSRGNRGLNFVRSVDVNEYFSLKSPDMAEFILSNYDNFYTYFLAGRQYSARAKLSAAVRRGDLSAARLVDIAASNAETLDYVADVSTLSTLAEKLTADLGIPVNFSKIKHNVNKSIGTKRRFETLEGLGLTAENKEKILKFCEMDYLLYTELQKREVLILE